MPVSRFPCCVRVQHFWDALCHEMLEPLWACRSKYASQCAPIFDGRTPWQPGALACCGGHHSAPHRTLPCPAMPCHAVRSLPIPSHGNGSDQREQPQSSSDYAAETLASICDVCLWDLPDGAWLWGLPTHSAVAVGRIRFHHRGRIQIRPINSLHCSIECAIPVPRIARPNSGIRPGQLGQPRAARRLPRPSLDPPSTLARQAGHSFLDAGQLASLRHSTPPQTHARVKR